MDITHCKEFLVLASRLNFTEAAAELNMTQPALSKHVSALEKEFGARLLDRNPRNLQLTEAGRIFVEGAADIIDRYERTKHSIATLRERTLLIGGHFGDTDISSFISMATLIAREDFDTYVTICGKTAESYIERLRSGEIDLFVGYIDPDEAQRAGLTVHTFFKDQLNAVMDSRHRLAKNASVTLDDLRNETLLHCGSGEIDLAWERIIAEIRQRGINPRTRFVPCDNPVTVFTTPLSGGVLLWKRTFREIGQLVATGSRASVPLSDDVCLTSHLAYLPETEQRLQGFFHAMEKARKLLGDRRDAHADGAREE